MCGIFGWLTTDNSNRINVEVGRSLSQLLSHRGPDAYGQYHSSRCFLGHQRLKVIDLSDEANQPMSDPSGRYYVIFNGEIYNYIELRKELEKEGLRFRTASDTEVLLRAYITWGKKCFSRLEGMFVFAIYDSLDHSLVLCRDFAGQKPLYYTLQGGHFIFASELRGIIEHPDVEGNIDIMNVFKYHIYDVFPFETTPIQNVFKLLPGHLLELRDGKVTIEKYWQSVPGAGSITSVDEALDQLDSLLTASLIKHLRSDVPYGVFLSGGVDPSLVAYYARKVLNAEELKTFVVAVNFMGFDERPTAMAVSDWLGCRSHVFHLDEQGIFSSMNEMFVHIDEPLADPGLMNAHFISKNARQHIKVALAGDGGDELFGGYVTFRAIPWLREIGYLPDRLLLPFIHLVRKMSPDKYGYMSLDFKLQQFMKGYRTEDVYRLPCWLAAFSPHQLFSLYKKDYVARFSSPGALNDELFHELSSSVGETGTNSLANVMLLQYQKFFLPEFVLAHTDRASMQQSLEVRCPLLDKPIFEFANTLPLHLKVNNSKLKVLLFELLNHLDFPQEAVRHPKRGFTFPLASWLRGRLKHVMLDVLSPENIDAVGVFDRLFIEQLIREHVSGKANHYRELWNLIVLFQWIKKYSKLTFHA